MKHTKGPWFKDGHFIRQVDDSGLIAELYISPNSNDGRNQSLTDNARLIAAAPEMLEALATIYNLANLQTLLETKYSRALVYDLMKQMEYAINKARSES